MALNIKNEETNRLIEEFPAILGKYYLGRDRGGPRRSLSVFGSSTSRIWLSVCGYPRNVPPPKEPYRSVDHGDLLYDEKGLPK